MSEPVDDSGLKGIPIVRHFVPCLCPKTDRGDAERRVTVDNVLYAREAGSLPRVLEGLSVLTVMSDGVGTHFFQVEVLRINPGEIEAAWTKIWNPGNSGHRLVLGERLDVFAFWIPFPNFVIAEAGGYEIRLLCDGRVIATSYFSVSISDERGEG